MNPIQIRNKLREQPFRAFRLYTSDGESFDITHPEMCQVTRDMTLVAVPGSADPSLWDDFFRLANEHITRIEPILTEARRQDQEGI